MINVKKMFFLTKEEAKKLHKKNEFILESSYKYPCFELENGKIMYPHYGCPSAGEIWWASLK